MSLTPRAVFEAISRIPRVSYNEKAISNFLVLFAKDRGLKVVQDQFLNVVIFKPATKGYEYAPTVMLQGHMDMVGEKNVDSQHNFDKDPIELIERDGFLYANGTTLGADDGVSIAYMLSILDSKTLAHPALECVITVQEEVGLIGAMELDCSELKSTLMIGLDCGSEKETVITSSGGCRADIWVDTEREVVRSESLIITVKGLLGGHSGGLIDAQRGNSLKVLGQIAYWIANVTPFQIASIGGGFKENAIPREASMEFIYPLDKKEVIIDAIQIVKEELLQQYKAADPDLTITVEPSSATIVYDEVSSMKLVNLLYMLPYGPRYKNVDIVGHILGSSNIGVVEAIDDRVRIGLSVRSAQAFLTDVILKECAYLAKAEGVEFDVHSRYGGWPYEATSKLRQRLMETYEALRHQPLQLEASNGGLELGILKSKMPQLDIIGMGPDMFDIHTPNEHLDLASFDRTYEVLVKLLESLIQPL